MHAQVMHTNEKNLGQEAFSHKTEKPLNKRLLQFLESMQLLCTPS